MFRHIPITDAAIWQATLDQWKADAQALGDEGVFLSLDVEQRLTGLKQLAEREDNFYCYFLVKNGNPFASSVLEVSHAMPGADRAWLKLLNITLQPSLLPIGDRATEVLKDAFTVLAYSITHVIELIFHELPSRKLKIYGRTSEMVTLFKAILSTDILDPFLDTFQLESRLEGNWLVLKKIDAAQ